MAMYENGNLMDVEIERLTKRLGSLDPDSDEYKAVRQNLESMYKLRNEQYKIEIEDDEKRQKLEKELEQKAAELEVRKSEIELAERRRQDEIKRSETEASQKAAELAVRIKETELKELELESESNARKLERVKDYSITGANLLIGVLELAVVVTCSIAATDQGYKFESDGCPTSVTFRETRKAWSDMIKRFIKR